MFCSDGEFEQETKVQKWLPDPFRDRDVLQEDATWLSDVLINASQNILKLLLGNGVRAALYALHSELR